MDTQKSLFDSEFERAIEAFKPLEKLLEYFNTTGLSGTELKKREFKTGTQNKLILDFFRSNPGKMMTPFDVQLKLGLQNTPITSVRRSITSLTKMGYLVKTSFKSEGIYGHENYCWKLKE